MFRSKKRVDRTAHLLKDKFPPLINEPDVYFHILVVEVHLFHESNPIA